MSISRLRQRSSVLLVLVLATLAFVGESVAGDLIVLRTGAELRGDVANREKVAAHPELFSSVSILLDQSGEEMQLRRVLVADIAYLVLDEEEGRRVIEFADLPAPPPVAIAERNPASVLQVREAEENDMTTAIVFGLVALGVGALVKFGDEQLVDSGSSVHHEEKTYNAVNYMLMGVGAIMVIAGFSVHEGKQRGALASIGPDLGSVRLGYSIRR